MTGVHQAYRYALDLTPRQERAVLSHCGAARVAYNWALARVKANLDQRTAERTYSIGEDDLTPSPDWSLAGLRRMWNAAKDEVAPWWQENSKESYNTGLDGLARGLKNWSDSKRGKRAGRRVGFPRFRSRHRAALSVRFTTGTIRVEQDRHHLTLPRLGTLKTHESTRKLARRVESGTARILSATVRREGGRWFVSFTCEVQRTERKPADPAATVGVDLGISHLAVCSQPVPGVTDGDGFVANPRHLRKAQKKLRRASRTVSRRQGPDRRSGQKASNRWKRANARRNRVHHRVANLRRDGIHKLTSGLAAQAGTVVAEDLNVSGMLSNRKLARAIADAGFGEIRRQLDYKTRWAGGYLVVADRWFASSKTCSDCGATKAKLPLRVRVFRCDKCGLILDRDVNAARNLATLAEEYSMGAGVAGNPEPTSGSKGRGADQKTYASGQVAAKRSPRTASTRVRRGPSAGNGGLLEIH
ncbi:IS607 family element RNA-guided endonuclease TnpB [Saccharopolyspora sp. NPDC050642]|uniref:IS607 family element RNA-guided endonuclease TnpB n=1 Tax=Saccharopolyspora sp. NPDC050642 TaxID=3157099 RepID=UPI0033ED857E